MQFNGYLFQFIKWKEAGDRIVPYVLHARMRAW